jgi:cardiolipin synthase (CMP-forming)
MTTVGGELGQATRPPNEAELLARVWTIPNAVTVARLFLAAAFVATLFAADNRFVAFAILAVTGISDFLDGFIARRIGQVTTIGKVIDPLTDRVVLVTAVISIVVFGAVPVWLAAVVVGRDALIGAVALVITARGAARVDVNWFGKAGTCGLMCGFPLMVLGHGDGEWARIVADLGWAFVVPALGLLFVASVLYVPAARKALEQGRGVTPAGG